MAFPYQCVVARSGSEENAGGWALYGASGPNLVVQTSAGVKTVWSGQESSTRADRNEDEDETEGPPGKRVKLDQVIEKRPNFSNLVLSHDGRYLVAVTGEDKCIRVFQLDANGTVQQLSERSMSRRPCSVTITDDDTTILCADKFGDVYALPLHYNPENDVQETPVVEEKESKDYTPAATVLTVHSGRNRKTLEDQLKQKAKGPAKSKEPMRFKHELLLGHVSMLTDIVYTRVEGRSYIITSDRDEHVRISRGQPQSHIVEGFCFGHEAFVNRLCITQSGKLVSGGGDDYLLVWDWQNCRLLQKLSIREALQSHFGPEAEESSLPIAVSGIWNVPSSNGEYDEIVVSCEGLAVLFKFPLGQSSIQPNAIPLQGNALDVAFVQAIPNQFTAVISIDNCHKANSKSAVQDMGISRLQSFAVQQNGQWQEDGNMQETLQWFNAQDTAAPSQGESDKDGQAKAARDILYNVETLRKRPGAED